MKIKGFDKNLQCRGMQFEVGKEYKIETDKEPELCTDTVFHYCDSLQKVHGFYSVLPSENNRFCEIEAIGKEVQDDEKCGCSHIKIIREIAGDELNNLRCLINGNSGLFNSGHYNSGDLNSGNKNSGLFNSGHYNSGNKNSGNLNSGDFNSGNKNSGNKNSGNLNSGNKNSGNLNSGDFNSGNRNSGNRNSGDWNNSSRETGFFNTHKITTVNVFNKPCDIEIWETANKPYFIYFDLTEFISFENMTDEEKQLKPKAEICGGYFKKMDYKEAFQKSYSDLSDEERVKQTALLKALPNFDADVFFEISGIRIE